MIKKQISIALLLGLHSSISLFWAKIQVKKCKKMNFAKKLSILHRKHSILLNFIEHKLAIAKRYDFNIHQPDLSYSMKSNKTVEKNTVYFFWWQGEECMPPLIKRCYERAKEMTKNWHLILITKYNLSEYLIIPKEVFQFGEKKSFTHLSDYIRLNLLAEYGGLWLDATFYLTQQLPLRESLGEFYTIKNMAKDNNCIAEYRWFVSFMYVRANCDYIRHIRNMFCYNWMRYDYIVDYLLMDYLFEYEYQHNAHFNSVIENLPYNNPSAATFSDILCSAYSEQLWKKINKNTFCYKLTYKRPYKLECNGSPTYYQKIINGEI